jgi:hypothetical protein
MKTRANMPMPRFDGILQSSYSPRAPIPHLLCVIRSGVTGGSRGDSGSPTRRIASLGMESPHSTSGQTGKNSTYWDMVSVINGSHLCPRL